MQITDLANSFFEIFGAALTLVSIHALYRDKQVKGVSVYPSFFFIGWGCWNLFYYHNLNQPISFFAGMFMLAVNVLWLAMAIYYKRSPPMVHAVPDY